MTLSRFHRGCRHVSSEQDLPRVRVLHRTARVSPTRAAPDRRLPAPGLGVRLGSPSAAGVHRCSAELRRRKPVVVSLSFPTSNFPTCGRIRVPLCNWGVSLFEGLCQEEVVVAPVKLGGIFGLRPQSGSPQRTKEVSRDPDRYSLTEGRPWTRRKPQLSNCLFRHFCALQSSVACSS